MKVIISGTRGTDILCPPHHAYLADWIYQVVGQAIRSSGFKIEHLITGAALGVDASAEDWARDNCIPYSGYPANWKALGKGAGPARNWQMAEIGDALIAIPGPASIGTWDMVRKMQAKNKPVYLWEGFLK